MPFDQAEARRIKAEKRAAAEAFQWSHRVISHRGFIWPAIGKTGGADNVGWELHVPHCPVRYYATKEQAMRGSL